MDYFEMRRKIVQFINESGISSYDLCRIGRDLCCCRTCKFFVQHYGKSGNEVDFGHCVRTNIIKGKRPHEKSCGYWTIDDGERRSDDST